MAGEAAADTTPLERKMSVQPLPSFLERLIKIIDNDIQSATEKSSTELQKSKDECCRLLKSSQSPDVTEDILRQNLRLTAHVVLEYTHLDENLLVDADFPVDSATSRMAVIHDLLDKVLQVAEESFKNQPVLETLGEEIVECIHWRKGALNYMYSHTYHSLKIRPADPVHYKQCLEGGVLELEKMLSIRQPITVPTDVSLDDTLQLFSHGVYSDTHLLAMVYAGELCYFHKQAISEGLFTPDTGNVNFSAQQKGVLHLEAYLSAVNGPLKGQFWDTDKAEKFIRYMRQDS